MKICRLAMLMIASELLFGCSTPASDFSVYYLSDGTVGVHAPKSAKESEVQEVATAECKKLGKRTAIILTSHPTVNDRFPVTYIYRCGF